MSQLTSKQRQVVACKVSRPRPRGTQGIIQITCNPQVRYINSVKDAFLFILYQEAHFVTRRQASVYSTSYLCNNLNLQVCSSRRSVPWMKGSSVSLDHFYPWILAGICDRDARLGINRNHQGCPPETCNRFRRRLTGVRVRSPPC